jgi:hypothetical protein
VERGETEEEVKGEEKDENEGEEDCEMLLEGLCDDDYTLDGEREKKLSGCVDDGDDVLEEEELRKWICNVGD